MKTLLNICRCCLSPDCYKDIFDEYYWSGRKEIYSEMLLNTFNIKILPEKHTNKSLICDRCVSRLQDASAFKEQILQSAKSSTEEGVNITNDGILKLENNYEDYFCDTISVEFENDDSTIADGDNKYQDDNLSDDSLDFDNEIDDNVIDDDFEWAHDEKKTKKGNKDHVFVIKLSTELAKVPENAIQLEKVNSETIEDKNTDVCVSHEFETGIDIEEIEASNSEIIEISKTSEEANERKNMNSIKGKTVKKKITTESKKSKKNRNVMLQSEKDIRDNTLKLILNSNLCLFESLKIKYRCFSCKEAYLNIIELKEHSKIHNNVKDLEKRIYRLRGLSYKFAEISNLKCKICDHSCLDLNELKEHLIVRHEIKFGETGDHFLIPYRIENDYNCVSCDEKFNTFLRLSIHMNIHYANNVCDICGASYINRLSLRMHVNAVHREKKCSMCSATFLTQNLRVKHMRKYHKAGIYRRYCLICDKTFPYTYQLVEHKIQEHGAERKIVTCDKCGKTFNTTQNLKIHNRSVHIRERNYHCSMCDMRFFTKCDQIRHETTHELSKTFSCSLCDVKFKTKDSVRRHLRKQHGLL